MQENHTVVAKKQPFLPGFSPFSTAGRLCRFCRVSLPESFLGFRLGGESSIAVT